MARDPFAQFDLRLAEEAFFIPKEEGQAKTVILPELYKDVEIFALLLWRFKRPNGVLSMLGSPQGDAAGPFKWDFNFVTSDGLKIAVIRTWRNIEIMLCGREVSREDVLAFLDFNLHIHKEEIAGERSLLERHWLIINPYARHRRMVTFASNELLRTKVPSIWYPPEKVVGRSQMKRHMDTLQKHMRGAQRETFFSVTLASEAAFMAEAFLNLLLVISLPDMIRNNRTLFEEALRRPWKSKLQHLPLTSTLVRKAPDLGDTRVRDAEKLFRLRNRITHSYPDEEDLRVGQIYFFENFPALDNAVPFDAYEADTQRALPTRTEALDAKRYADGLVAFICEQVEPEAQEDMRRVSTSSPLGFSEGTRRFSVIFGDEMVRHFLGAPEESVSEAPKADSREPEDSRTT